MVASRPLNPFTVPFISFTQASVGFYLDVLFTRSFSSLVNVSELYPCTWYLLVNTLEAELLCSDTNFKLLSPIGKAVKVGQLVLDRWSSYIHIFISHIFAFVLRNVYLSMSVSRCIHQPQYSESLCGAESQFYLINCLMRCGVPQGSILGPIVLWLHLCPYIHPPIYPCRWLEPIMVEIGYIEQKAGYTLVHITSSFSHLVLTNTQKLTGLLFISYNWVLINLKCHYPPWTTNNDPKQSARNLGIISISVSISTRMSKVLSSLALYRLEILQRSVQFADFLPATHCKHTKHSSKTRKRLVQVTHYSSAHTVAMASNFLHSPN